MVLHSAWGPQHHELAGGVERLRFRDELSAERLASVPEEYHQSIFEVAEECDALLSTARPRVSATRRRPPAPRA